MEPITLVDLRLINSLSSRTYTDNSLLSNATSQERDLLGRIKTKLGVAAAFFSRQYADAYGPFDTSVSTGNPIAIGGVTFKRVWSGLFKGAPNKQYAAQISFVMNPNEECLDVGFYFGSAAGHSLSNEQKTSLTSQLNNLGTCLSDAINNDYAMRTRYNSLFDFGFVAYANGIHVSADAWSEMIKTKSKGAHIIAKIYPNDFGIIENSTIDAFVSQIIFLMGAFRDENRPSLPVVIKPLTPEQRAKQAERLAQIGLKGELYVMAYEESKLANLGIHRQNYPRHVALESMHYGYDILSLDENGNDLYIEVKTTTRNREDPTSREFFISTNEIETFLNLPCKKNYKLYRVYDIEAIPNFEMLDLGLLERRPDGYIAVY